MKILLVNPVFHDKQSVFTQDLYPPIGLMQVAAHYRKTLTMQRHNKEPQITICDGQVMSREEVWNNFVRIKPDMVGLNVIIGQPLKDAWEISERIKEYSPDVKIVWGGALTRVTPYLAPDFVELDDSFFDEFPAWDLIENPSQYLPALFTSRGCPFMCGFCYHNKDQVIKFTDVTQVINTMKYMDNNFGWKEFKIMDDNFFTNRVRAINIIEQMRKLGYRIKQVHSHANCFTEDIIEALDSSIVSAIGISIEHGSQAIVDRIGKKLNIEKTIGVIEKLGKRGIKTIHNFIFGLPYGQDDNINFITMDKIRKTNPNTRGVGFSYAPMPETPITNYIESKFGKYPRTYKFWKDFDMSVINRKYNKWMTEKEILETQRMADKFNALNH